MDIGWKLASTVAAGAAAFVASKVAEQGWKLATGHDAPRGEDEEDANLVQVLVFAVVSAALVTLAQRYAMKGAKRWYGGPATKSLPQA